MQLVDVHLAGKDKINQKFHFISTALEGATIVAVLDIPQTPTEPHPYINATCGWVRLVFRFFRVGVRSTVEIASE
jgi:hypothetical protein